MKTTGIMTIIKKDHCLTRPNYKNEFNSGNDIEELVQCQTN